MLQCCSAQHSKAGITSVHTSHSHLRCQKVLIPLLPADHILVLKGEAVSFTSVKYLPVSCSSILPSLRWSRTVSELFTYPSRYQKHEAFVQAICVFSFFPDDLKEVVQLCLCLIQECGFTNQFCNSFKCLHSWGKKNPNLLIIGIHSTESDHKQDYSFYVLLIGNVLPLLYLFEILASNQYREIHYECFNTLPCNKIAFFFILTAFLPCHVLTQIFLTKTRCAEGDHIYLLSEISYQLGSTAIQAYKLSTGSLHTARACCWEGSR